MRRSLLTLLLLCLLSGFSADYAMAQTGTEQALYDFCAQAQCTDGVQPQTSLILASDGNFYGTTTAGGAGGAGTLFRITPDGVLTTVYSFCTQSQCADGAGPSGIIEGSDGNFWGVTSVSGEGSSYTGGTIFKMSMAGELTTVYAFCVPASCPQGAVPYAPLVEGSDGNFYGATYRAGSTEGTCSGIGCGTVFKITPAGTLTVLHSFEATGDGANTSAGLVEGSDGNFYGTTPEQGSFGGSVYQISPSGSSFHTLYTFCTETPDPCEISGGPSSGVVEGSDGDYYGTADGYGAYDGSVAYKVAVSGSTGTLSNVYSFCALANCADGSFVSAPLYPGSDGNFYGTAEAGASEEAGTVFRLTPAGTLTTLHSFCASVGCTDGRSPYATPVQGVDGNLYGTTFQGGTKGALCETYGCGVVYEVALAPALAAPVQLTLSAASMAAGTPVTLAWKVLNAYSKTLQRCFATVQGGTTGAGAWSGIQSGVLSDKSYAGSAVLTPDLAGTYTYALTCGGVESGFATLKVTASAKISSATAMTASPNPASIGQTITLKATVSGAGATPTGSVNFEYESAAFATPALSGGVADFQLPTELLPAGTYSLTAAYQGSPSYDASSSPAYPVTVNIAPTSIELTASPNPVTPPATLTLTATVKRSAAGASGTPTGMVAFYLAGQTTPFATETLSAGAGKYVVATTGFPAGTYDITAKYGGDGSDAVSTSAALAVVVK